MNRQNETDACTLSQRTCRIHGSIMRQHRLSRNCQPEAGPSRLMRHVRLPYERELRRIDPRTVIGNRYLN